MMIMYFSLVLLLTVYCHAEVSSVEVAVQRYQALQYQEIENLEHLYYTFEFCSCNDHFTGRLPSLSPNCECTSPQQGKRVLESTPHAIFPSACVHSSASSMGKCLNAKFTSEDPGRHIFVKVMVGRNIFTFPSWQLLPNGKYKTTTTLSSSAGSSMKISYVISLKKEQTSSAIAVPSWKKSHPKETSQSGSSMGGLRSELFDILRDQFTRHKTEQNKKKPKSLPEWKEDAENWKSAKEWKTTRSSRTTHETTTAEPPMAITQATTKAADIRDVVNLRSINDVKMFILKESLRDMEYPTKYDVETFRDQMLQFHNVYRAKHSSPAVRQDSQLEREAQRWAEHLASTSSCLVHETPRKHGENLFYFGGRILPKPSTMAKAVIQSFYMEKSEYSYSQWRPMSYFKTGHFTQLVWADSRKIGVGIAIKYHDGSSKGPCAPSRPSFMIYVCVKYDPPGNFNTYEAFSRNVRPPIA